MVHVASYTGSGERRGEEKKKRAWCLLFVHAPKFPRFLGNRKLTSNPPLQMRLQMLARSARYAGWQPAAAVGSILTVCATVRDVTPETKVASSENVVKIVFYFSSITRYVSENASACANSRHQALFFAPAFLEPGYEATKELEHMDSRPFLLHPHRLETMNASCMAPYSDAIKDVEMFTQFNGHWNICLKG